MLPVIVLAAATAAAIAFAVYALVADGPLDDDDGPPDRSGTT